MTATADVVSAIELPDQFNVATYFVDRNVAEGRGSFQVKSPATSSGFDEAGIVFTGDVKSNTSPANPEGRGQGICPP